MLGKREDGYHTVSTVMQQVSLYDLIELSWEEGNDEKLNIYITTNRPYLPTDERNIAYKAALLMNEIAQRTGTLRIRIQKRIPVAAGLAGGSGNAAAVMIGLNVIWGIGLNTHELCEISTRIGSDLPFMILVQNTGYTCAFGEGTGEKLTPLKRGLDLWFSLSKPKFGVSTKEVYAGIDSAGELKHPDTKGLIRALNDGKPYKAISKMANVLEEYTLKAYPEVLKLKDRTSRTEGALFAMMSGSGPTVIGFYDNFNDAKNAVYTLRGEGYESYYATSMRRIRGRIK